MNQIYDYLIFQRYNDLIISGKTSNDMDNYDLAKIFEYYTCIKLHQTYDQIFYHYDDINPTFKEDNKMSRTDTVTKFCYKL